MARKSGKEARIERVTWVALVIVVVAYAQFDLYNYAEPYWFAAAAGASLLLSGVYQYMQKWKVAPTTWIGGTLMLVAAGADLYFESAAVNSIGITLLITIVILLFAIVTNET